MFHAGLNFRTLVYHLPPPPPPPSVGAAGSYSGVVAIELVPTTTITIIGQPAATDTAAMTSDTTVKKEGANQTLKYVRYRRKKSPIRIRTEGPGSETLLSRPSVLWIRICLIEKF